MNSLILLFSLLLLVIMALIFYLWPKTLNRLEERREQRLEERRQLERQELLTHLRESLGLVQQQVTQLAQLVNQQLQGIHSHFQQTTGQIGENLGQVREHLGKMEIATKEVLEKAKSIASLEELLRAPKFRGGLGELFLSDLLAQILPPAHYTLQYRFKNGEKVDAVIQIGNNLVPVDAKFPLENFRRFLQEENQKEKETWRRRFYQDVRKHIDDIASKYIRPEENTYDFALMYIPAENIYYETIIREESLAEEKSLFSYALQKRVIPVSPNSFFAYLQVIVLGLKGLQIEKSARTIFQALAQLEGDLSRFRSDFQTLGSHLINARGKFEEAERKLDRLTTRVEQLVATGEKEPQLPPLIK
ncbi:MAG: DNA recombination protein RmuC [Candidatus Aminicenantes bacterium]|nr:DNA recombination protein RmuC [Candidatus Aminicenantes bacterium]